MAPATPNQRRPCKHGARSVPEGVPPNRTPSSCQALTGRASLPLLLIAGVFVWLFADALFRGQMFAVRDAAHFYYPLFSFIQDQWAAGRVPLWNPYENLGMPLVGAATSSVFYPGKLIFFLPFPYDWAYKIYLMAHVALAAATAYRLARHWKASPAAAAVAALSYAFCGNVLFQYANVVFLVGAAWLPAAMLAADRMLTRRSIGWALAFAAVLAIIVLGGDPQTAYHAVLLAAMYAIWIWRCRRGMLAGWHALRNEGRGKVPNHALRSSGTCHPRTYHPVLLALAVLAALLLSAIQVLPSAELALRSDRTTARAVEARYDFSVGPWRLAEYLWPNVGGRQFPTHRRWFDALPAEGRAWVPSLYMGLLPLLLALSRLRFFRRGFTAKGDSPRPTFGRCPAETKIGTVPARDRWLSWTVALAVWASLGRYGGLYWLMTVLLPGYSQFRYPAKLLGVAALGLSMLAARGWDVAWRERASRLRRLVLGLGLLSLLAALAAGAVRPFWPGWLSGVEPNILFGPLDAIGAANDLLTSFVQTAVLCGAFWWLLRKAARATGSASAVQWTALLLVAIDLITANAWLVGCAPATDLRRPSSLAVATGGDEEPLRILREPVWFPPDWATSSNPARLAQCVRWDRDTLYSNFNLLDRIASAEVYGTMMLADYEALLAAPRQRPLAETVGAKYTLGPVGDAIHYNPRCRPRAWITHETEGLARGESCRIVRYEPLCVELEAELTRPGQVVLCDQFYPGWKLEVETAGQGRRNVEIERTNQVMRGCMLPAGRHRLIYRYRPASFLIGAIASALAWLVVAGVFARRVLVARP